jgi:hypothetical protein
LRSRINASGVADVLADLRELPSELRFDLIFLVDSLYCFSRPSEVLSRLTGQLGAEGVVVIRIANRTPLLNLMVVFRMKDRISRAQFGDQLVAFSHRGMETAIANAGLRIERVLYFEHKSMRRRPWSVRLMYWLLPVIARITGWSVSPGLIYVCTKADRLSRGEKHARALGVHTRKRALGSEVDWQLG